MACRTRDTAFTGTFEVDVVLVCDVKDRVAFVGFDGFEVVAFGVFEVESYAVWGMSTLDFGKAGECNM